MASRAQRTRERILETSLGLFNRRGAPNVTTNDIAQELDISPGNLYYHFRNKSEIVHELFARFRVRLADTLLPPGGQPVHVEDVWLFLHLLFEQVRDYRFLFRDLNDLTGRDPRLRREFAQVLAAVAEAARQLYRGLAAAGVLRADEEEIDALAEGSALIAAYWLSYQGIRGAGLKGDAIGRGVYQAMAGLAPFLRRDARTLLDRLARRYL